MSVKDDFFSMPLQVAIPLLILPLLCAAYAEVNVEGKRLLKVSVLCISRG